MNRIIMFYLFSIMSLSAQSQDVKIVNVSFIPLINNEILKIKKDISIDTTQSFKINISKLKFYVSNLSFYKNEKLIWKDNIAAHLIDAENDMGIKLSTKINNDFNLIKFGLGIDSITNVSGALDGDLDPLKGMYWTWQTGYVNFKLEGTMPDKNWLNEKFEYHLGGYSGENNAYNTVILSVENSNEINVSIDLDKFIADSYIRAHPNIMSPGKIAVDFSKILTSCFIIK